MIRDNDILATCVSLHMTNTGAANPITKEEYEECILFLTSKLDKWLDSYPPTRAFDDAVRNLINVTLQETVLKMNELNAIQ